MSQPTPPRPDRPAPDGPAWRSPSPRRWPERLPTAPAVSRPSWRWWEAIGVFLVGVAVTIPITVPVARGVGSGTGEVVAALVSDVVIAAVLVVWLQLSHRGWRASIGFPGRVGPEIGAGLGWGVAIYGAVALVVGGVIVQFLRALTGEPVTTPSEVPGHLGAAGNLFLVIRAVATAPAVEEFFFRILVFGGLRARHGFWWSAVIASVAFGLVHAYPGSWTGMIALMGTIGIVGIGLCALYERRGNIVANVVAHATFNTIGLVLIANFR